MKSLRIIGAILGTIGMISMFSCGGSSYLSEFPGEGENTNVTTITAGGLAGGSTANSSLASKDIELPPLDGTTGGSGDAYMDAGLHECFFEPPAASSTGLITIKATEAECSGITNCGWCEATQVGYPNCEVTCTLNTAASEDFIGEYLEMTYVDWAILYSDAGGSSGGALRGEGEALNSPSLGSHLFDSTSRAFTITDGGLTLDQVTPLTDVQSIDKFDYTMAITDMILDPTASSHNAALPDNTAWVDIETRVVAQIPLDELAIPEGVANMDAGLYASNWGFWHDAANEQDIMAFVEMFNQTLEFNDADILSYINCSTAWEELETDVICMPLITSRTDGVTPELIEISTATDSAVMENIDITDQAACAAVGGGIGSDYDPNLPTACYPMSMLESVDEYPVPSDIGDAMYALDVSYTVDDAGSGEKSVTEYLAAIYENSVTADDNLIDISESCEGTDGMQRALLQNIEFFGDPSSLTAECIAVMERFIVDPTIVEPFDRTATGDFSVEFLHRGWDAYQYDYMRLFFNDHDTNTDHVQYGLGPGGSFSIPYGEKLIHWNPTCMGANCTGSIGWGIRENRTVFPVLTDWGASTLDYGITNEYVDQTVYGRDNTSYGDVEIQVQWIDQANAITDNNDFNIVFNITADSAGNPCGPFGFYASVVGDTVCADKGKYLREHVYFGQNSDGYFEEEAFYPYMSSMFDNGTYTYQLGIVYGATNYPEDWREPVATPANNEMSLRDRRTYCVNLGSHLVARPIENVNAIDLPTDPAVKDICLDVVNRFVDGTIGDGDVGNDIEFPLYPVRVEFEAAGTSSQGIKFLILDGGTHDPGWSIFEDITGTYASNDYTKIPARGGAPYSYGDSLWFTVDQRVVCETNRNAPIVEGGSGDLMSIYSSDGSAPGGGSYKKVSTRVELGRVRESDMHKNRPENEYVLFLPLNEPVDDLGYAAAVSCGIDLGYLIDGTCECHLTDSCNDFSWE